MKKQKEETSHTIDVSFTVKKPNHLVLELTAEDPIEITDGLAAISHFIKHQVDLYGITQEQYLDAIGRGNSFEQQRTPVAF